MRTRRPSSSGASRVGPTDPEWFKDAIIYELHVRSFQDSNGDGVGDFRGLTTRLGYLQDLGVTAIWLLPFYPSPLRDDGYDIADYKGVHPDYGTLADFTCFLAEAHRRGLRVITELVINHTSDEHPWYQRARTSRPGSPEREFYVWSASPERYQGARVIFQDFEQSNWSWDPVAKAYFWHRFYSHQPDLNFDNPAVLTAVQGVLEFWFGLGVDGMRLDAVPYLVEREGTHSENLRQTHDVLKRLRHYIDAHFANRMLLAEANQWPEDAAAYFGKGDESHMVFHFPLMPRLFMAMRQEDRLPIVDILQQTPAAPAGCQWGLFLRNHDELTLEMVTEEERQYMYHVYATDPQARINLGIRRRLAPLVGNDRRRIELMNLLLFSLPGTPFLYYGDEIGMGDNIYLGDRNGVRTPMQWSGDRNAGFSTAPPQRLFLPLIVDDQYHHHAVHVEQQAASGSSILSWMTRLIAVRKRYQAFGRGDFAIVESPNPHILAFTRRWRRQQMLVVANLSRFAQHAQLELSMFEGLLPVELFGRTSFPPITADPYAVTLGPHGCHWFELKAPGRDARDALPELQFARRWQEVLDESGRAELAAALPRYLEKAAAWASGARTVLSARIEDILQVPASQQSYALLVVRLTFTTGEPQQYLLPVGCRTERGTTAKGGAIATLHRTSGTARAGRVLYDASLDPGLARALLRLVRDRRAIAGTCGALVTRRRRGAPALAAAGKDRRIPRVRPGANALVGIGGGMVLKLFRQLESGRNPEVELCSYLNDAGFAHAPVVHGSLHYHVEDSRRREPVAVGILQRYVDNEGEAWPRAIAAAEDFLRRAARRREADPSSGNITPSLRETPDDDEIREVIGSYADAIRLIALRVAGLHRALASATDPDMAPEPFGPLSRRSAYQRMRTLAASVTGQLHLRGVRPAQVTAEFVSNRDAAVRVFSQLVERAVNGQRIRIHGNLHLGQILHTTDDIVIIDFEGEPGRPLYERRLKASPLQDVATLVRSFHYAAHAALRRWNGRRSTRLTAWMRHWQRHVGALFVSTYANAIEDAALLPRDEGERALLLHAHLLERAFYELGFELTHRSDWAAVPLQDIPALLGSSSPTPGARAPGRNRRPSPRRVAANR